MDVRRVAVGLGALAVVGFLAAPGDLLAAKDKEKKGPALRYVATYAEAWAQAKARNVPIYVTFHKDH